MYETRLKEEEFKALWESKHLVQGRSILYKRQRVWVKSLYGISLHSGRACNLTEMNVSDIESQDDLDAKLKAAAFIGTLKPGYTDFHYLRDFWKKDYRERGTDWVGMTGIGSGSFLITILSKLRNV